MDLLGCTIVGTITSIGGGTIRDLLIGVCIFGIGKFAYNLLLDQAVLCGVVGCWGPWTGPRTQASHRNPGGRTITAGRPATGPASRRGGLYYHFGPGHPGRSRMSSIRAIHLDPCRKGWADRYGFDPSRNGTARITFWHGKRGGLTAEHILMHVRNSSKPAHLVVSYHL